MLQNKFKLLYKALLIAFLIIAFYIGNIVFLPQEMLNNEYILIINKHENLTLVAQQLKKDNMIKSTKIFLFLLKLLNYDKKVNAGMYILKHPMSLWAIVNRITHGKPDQISITILEGWTFDELKKYMDNLADIKHLTTTASGQEIKQLLKIPYKNLEGMFYPDTYFIVPGQSDLEIYQQAYKTMQLKIESLYIDHESITAIKSPYELLILASLIQKETANPNDMVLVSTVFNNRLRVGMKLQDDPAVFYGLKEQNKVTRKDFQIDTPYNTYLNTGLPPTPICIPSLNALKAAANPINKKDVLYFVAIGGGKTKFTDSYNEHKKAINTYLKPNKK